MLKYEILLKHLHFKIVESTDPVVRPRLANYRHHDRRNLCDSRQLTTSPNSTIGNNKHELLIILSCHLIPLKGKPTCESAIKSLHNSLPLCTC